MSKLFDRLADYQLWILILLVWICLLLQKLNGNVWEILYELQVAAKKRSVDLDD